jgi:hypothetical protein
MAGSVAAGAPAQLAHAAQKLGVGLQQRYRGKRVAECLARWCALRIAPPQDSEARFCVDSCKRFISILYAYYFLFLGIQG